MGNGKVINDVLVHLFNEVWQLEKSALTAGEFKDLTYNDMHIIEAVGLDGQKMSDIAAALHITVGSLTTSMNGLVKKGYTERERSGKDRRGDELTVLEKALTGLVDFFEQYEG